MNKMAQTILALSYFCFIMVTGCASSQKVTEAPAQETLKAKVVDAPAATASATPSPDVEVELQKIRAAVAEAKKVVEENKHEPHTAHKKATGVEPEKALGWLKNGNTRYLKGFLRKDGQAKSDIARLAKGQKPHSVILSCSDSRVPPELLFDQKLGEVFVVRTAGESLDPSVIASIEYAVEHLGSRLIVVLGHSMCGAVKATLDAMSGADLGSSNLNHLAADLMPRLKEFSGQPRSSDLSKEVNANTKGVAKDLVLRSPLIREKYENKEIRIVSALYHLEDGKVEFE